ncbi:zinc-binding alcohol dehydrogenase family protein [Virgibacillus salinus]|uniref:L-gulonate 5-dehydrogenase n=1 Tax=Virgibacillus salinus TaxID=553311 RepID=A0A1H0Z0M8_9BACI|nr:zinc-binding alcohol dehydrogenase family protein [Virgibacillus salinus]SDQ21012.1 L-gulonate 5-dehydrogenase [Virgibacillus salinus]
MRAIQVKEPHDLRVAEVEEPKLMKSNEVKVRMKAMGICGSDMHILHGQNPFASYPRIIGHEVAGEIEGIGDAVSGLSVGDKVVIEPMTSCGECYACKQGRPNVCEHVEVYGVHREGGGREVTVMPENLVHRVDSSLDWSEIALIEPFSIGAQATYRGQIQNEDMVYIIGAGPIGLCCLKMALNAGAKVAISDFNQERLDFARKWGADLIINPRDQDVSEALSNWTSEMGANVVIDAVGTPKTAEQAIDVTSVAARVVLLGFHVDVSRIAQVNITKKELTICGSRLQTHRFPKVVELFNSKDFDVKDLISHEFALDDVQEAFKLMEEMPSGVRKVIIKL